MERVKKIGSVRITGRELREGVLDGETWPLIFEENNKAWKKLGGCELGKGRSACKNSTFNYFPTSHDAVIEWSEDEASTTKNVIATKAKDAVIDVARMPYLTHPETEKRPTLLAFEITGHVMLGVVYALQSGRRAIHILNPWSLQGEASLLDVYALLRTLGPFEKKIMIVDVVTELETRFGPTINLQEHEKVGFCTLWVGILAKAVIPRLGELQESIRQGGIGDVQLSERTLMIYKDVYTGIIERWDAVLQESKAIFGEDKCPTASAARAVLKLAQAGKRKYRRQTKRRPVFRKKWTRKRRNL